MPFDRRCINYKSEIKNAHSKCTYCKYNIECSTAADLSSGNVIILKFHVKTCHANINWILSKAYVLPLIINIIVFYSIYYSIIIVFIINGTTFVFAPHAFSKFKLNSIYNTIKIQ